MDDETRPSLLMRLRDAQDAGAWESFVRLYGPLVFRHARRRGLQSPDAEDVSQQVFTRVMNGIHGFEYDPARGRFRDWLGTIVRNEVFKFLNRQRRDPLAGNEILGEVAGGNPDAEWLADFQAHVLQLGLEQCRPHFEPETWSAFEQVWLGRQSVATVAAVLDRTPEWVYVAKSRVLKRLWATIQDMTDDLPLLDEAALR